LISRRASSRSAGRATLTPKEYRLLQLLAQHAGNVVTTNTCLRRWGSPHMHDTHHLRIFVRKRQKIEQDPTQPQILLTELGVGYRLANPEAPSASQPERRRDHHPAPDRAAIAYGAIVRTASEPSATNLQIPADSLPRLLTISY
jgi:DNA-binding winged helix-turn-helix (wHTH) protein